MTLNAGIILGGQQPDILGAMDKGRAMAEAQIGLNRQNALAELYRTQGAQIAAGDQNALNALAAFDPNASLGVQGNILGLQAQKQDMQFSAEKMQMLRDESKREAAAALAAQADKLTAEQLAQEQQALSEALSGGAFFYQNKDKAGYDAFLQSKGLDPAEYPFEAFPAHAATVEGVLDAMKAFQPPTINPNDRFKVAGGTIFDLAAEGGPQPVGQGAMPETTVYGPDGKPIMTQGGPGAGAKLSERQSQIALFGSQMDQTAPVIDALENSGFDPSNVKDRVASFFGEGGNVIKSKEYQKYEVAGRAWAEAVLRLQTGAAATQPEIDRVFATYFAIIGDDPETVAYKKQLREGYRRSVEAAAGRDPNALPQEAAPAAKPAATGNTTSSGVQWSIVE